MARNSAGVERYGTALLSLLDDLEELLGTDTGFMLGPRIADARRKGSSQSIQPGRDLSKKRQAADGLIRPRDGVRRSLALSDNDDDLARYYERNLRLQYTIWGTNGSDGDSEISDYANKMYAGMVASFYRPRCACL